MQVARRARARTRRWLIAVVGTLLVHGLIYLASIDRRPKLADLPDDTVILSLETPFKPPPPPPPPPSTAQPGPPPAARAAPIDLPGPAPFYAAPGPPAAAPVSPGRGVQGQTADGPIDLGCRPINDTGKKARADCDRLAYGPRPGPVLKDEYASLPPQGFAPLAPGRWSNSGPPPGAVIGAGVAWKPKDEKRFLPFLPKTKTRAVGPAVIDRLPSPQQ